MSEATERREVPYVIFFPLDGVLEMGVVVSEEAGGVNVLFVDAGGQREFISRNLFDQISYGDLPSARQIGEAAQPSSQEALAIPSA